MGETVKVGDQDAYLAQVGRAGVLLLPMITGIGEQVREWADELAGEGLTALVWDPFKGRSTDNTPREELSALLQQMDDDTALAEQTELLDHLTGELGCSKVSVIGWCLGGRFAFLLGARDHRGWRASSRSTRPCRRSCRRITRTTRSPKPPGSPRRCW